VVSVPARPAEIAMRVVSAVGLAPFAPYHWLLYGRSLWFDTTRARTELGWQPRYSNVAAVLDSYRWYLEHRDESAGHGRSHHQSPARMGAMAVLKRL
jgi:nucleoside-diphosphate-sugar epimerase